MRASGWYLPLWVALCLLPGPGAAQVFGDSVTVHEAAEQDQYLFGRSVEVQAAVDGDVVAGGGDIRLVGDVHGDVMAAGGFISLSGTVSDDVRVAGGRVQVSARIGDDLLAAGGKVVLSSGTTVDGRAWMSGSELEIDGSIGGELRASGRRVRLAGEVRGDARITAEELELLPGAVVHGTLVYRSPQRARIDSQAEVRRGVRQVPMDAPAPGPGPAGLEWLAPITLATAAVVLYLLFPRRATATARRIGRSPWAALGLGLAVLTATPLVVALLFASVLGVWLGLILLAAYLAALPAGLLLGLLFVGDAGAQAVHRRPEPGKGRTAFWLLLSVVALWLSGGLPLLGGLVGLALLLAGLGALSLGLHALYVREERAAPTPAPAR